MPPDEASHQVLRRLFRKTLVVDLSALFRALDTRSRMTVFRRLKEVGYFSSYSHSGRYYTLADIPRFDDHGLWLHQGVGFSSAGTLKSTVVKLVDAADAGYTPRELEELLRVRVRNPLVTLTREAKIVRETVDRSYVYVSPDPNRAAAQISARNERLDAQRQASPLSSATIVEILVEVIQLGQVQVAAQDVAARLTARGIVASASQVHELLLRYGVDLEKKGD